MDVPVDSVEFNTKVAAWLLATMQAWDFNGLGFRCQNVLAVRSATASTSVLRVNRT